MNTALKDPADFNLARLRQQFPVLSKQVNGSRLVYLDNGASAQKPLPVLDVMDHYQRDLYANVHRGVHSMSAQMTRAYEEARQTIADFLGAGSADEIVYTSNATDAFNLLAHSYGQAFLKKGDEIILSTMEHHANIVPWQLLRQRLGIVIKVAPITQDGDIDLDAYEALFTDRTKLVSITHCSNVLGTVTPAKQLAQIAHKHGAHIAFDGAQGAVHQMVNVQDIDADFYVITGHKLYGPTGIGVLYGKTELLDKMPPFKGGGDMVDHVSFDETTFKPAPQKFEAGTPPFIEAIGLGAAISFMQEVGMDTIATHESDLLETATRRLQQIEGLHIYGTSATKAAILSFTIDGIHAMDLAMLLDEMGIAIRVGHHCAYPLMEHLGISSSARASFGMYNGHDDIDALIKGIETAKRMLS